MPPAAAVVPSPSGTPPSSSPKVATPQAASLPSSSTEHNALTAGRDAMSSIHHREGATSLLPSSSPIVAKPPKKRKAVVVAGLSTSSTATRDDSTTVTTTHPPSSSSQQHTTPPPPQRVCSRCACLSSCAWHDPKPPRTRRCARRVTGAKRSNWSTKMPLVRNDENVETVVQIENSRRGLVQTMLPDRTGRAATQDVHRVLEPNDEWTLVQEQVVAGWDLCNNCYGKVRVNARAIFSFFQLFFVVVPDGIHQSKMM